MTKWPLELVSADINKLNGKNYLGMVVVYSGFVEGEHLSEISIEHLIKAMKSSSPSQGTAKGSGHTAATSL